MAERKKAPQLKEKEKYERDVNGSVLDRSIPLGYPSTPAHIESGMSAGYYYKLKHGPRGSGPGRFYPLHHHVGWDDRVYG